MSEPLTDMHLKTLETGSFGDRYAIACKAAAEIRELRCALRNLVNQIEHEDGAIECGYAHEVLGDEEPDDE